MRVLFLAGSFTDEPTTGFETRVFNTCVSLAKKGIQVDVVCDPLNSKITSSIAKRNKIRLIPIPRLPHDLGPFAYTIVSIRQIKNALQKNKYDVVHGQAYANSVGAALLKNLSDQFPPFVITVDDLYTLERSQIFATQYSLSKKIRTFLYHNLSFTFDWFSLRRANHVIAVSNSAKEEIMKELSFPEDSITVIRNGVDLKEFSPSHRDDRIKERFDADKIVLTVTHLGFRKSVDTLIHAAAQVLKVFPRVKFVIVGTGEDLTNLRKLSKALGTSNSIYFVGKVSSQFLKKLYATASAFVLPSIYESHPTPSTLEAMVSGCPVIASKISDVDACVINGETGILTQPGNASVLADAILKILEDRNFSEHIKTHALSSRNSFSWDAVADQHIDLYKRLAME